MTNRHQSFSLRWLQRSWPLLLSVAVHTTAVGAPLLFYAMGSPEAHDALPKGSWGSSSSLTFYEVVKAPPPPSPPTTAPPTTEDVVVAAQKPKPLAQPQPAQETKSSASPEGGEGGTKTIVLGSPQGIGQGELKYHDELFLLFESKKSYPQAARRLKQQGEVLVSLRIWANGRIDDHRVIKASPYHRLNQAALGLVQEVDQFKPLPPGTGPFAYFHLPIEYSIN